MIIMGGDKKRTLNQILGEPESKVDEGAEEALSDIEMIAQDLLQCIDEGDSKGIANCLKAFIASCGVESKAGE